MSATMNDVSEDDRRVEAQPVSAPSRPAAPPAAYPLWMIGGSAVGEGGMLSLRDIVLIVCRGWWIILVAVVLCMSFAVYFLHGQAKRYTVSMTISAAGGDQSAQNLSGGILGAVSQGLGFGGAAAQQPEFERFKYHLSSRIVAQRLQEKHGLLQIFYSGDWDEKTGSWMRPQSTGWQGAIKRYFGLPDWTPPSTDSIADDLEGMIKFESLNTVMENVWIEIGDPGFGVQLMEMLYQEADLVVRERDAVHIQKQVGYLEQKLKEVVLTDQRQALTGLLYERLRRSMLIHGGLPYAAELVSPPHASPTPTSPDPIRFLTIALVGSILLGIITVFVVEALRAR